MSNTPLWDKFATIQNFTLAWQRTVNCSSRIVNDELGIKYFSYNLQSNLEDLLRKVQAEDYPYIPLNDHKVYVPKPSTTLRTMSLMAIPDLIVYQALVNVIADESHGHLVNHENQHVLGNLYSGAGSRWMLKRWKEQYTRFVERVEKIFSDGNPWIASTDIVAFYDTIDHERLIGLIKKYCGEDDRFTGFFKVCLSRWSPHNPDIAMSRGIPQGSNASDFLANLFLFDIDREMIVHGYHYIRYVDDVRILGAEKPIVQKGLILFDLELKKAGLVAQVSKTSVHEIKNIEDEISKLRFIVTDPADDEEYILVTVPSIPKSEQAESVSKHVHNTPSEETELTPETEVLQEDEYADEDTDHLRAYPDIDKQNTKTLQEQLRQKFLEMLPLLDDPSRSKEADSSITFLLYRLDPDNSVVEEIIKLLDRLPWRSEAVTTCLGKYSKDKRVSEALRSFIARHDVYIWHRANTLCALYQVTGANPIEDICRNWVADSKLDWYARTIAARILASAPGQHAFLLECLKLEQANANNNHQTDTEILRQELAYGAYQRIKSKGKQLSLLKLICNDPSPLLKRLALYLLQQPSCKVTWEDLSDCHQNMKEFSDLIGALGIAPNAPRHCLIAETLAKTYEVPLAITDLRPLYQKHYPNAVAHLRDSISAFHNSPDTYIREFHQFAHLTIIAFYEIALPGEKNLYETNGYGGLVNRAIFSQTLPKGLNTWKDLGGLRNRVDHPIDAKLKTHSRRIEYKEVDNIYKQLKVALSELFDSWQAPPTTSTP
jgi:hypothetical protein